MPPTRYAAWIGGRQIDPSLIVATAFAGLPTGAEREHATRIPSVSPGYDITLNIRVSTSGGQKL